MRTKTKDERIDILVEDQEVMTRTIQMTMPQRMVISLLAMMEATSLARGRTRPKVIRKGGHTTEHF